MGRSSSVFDTDRDAVGIEVFSKHNTKTSLDRKKKAVDQLEAALLASKQSQSEPALHEAGQSIEN